MLQALDALVKRDVVHCDLKSENILIKYNSQKKELKELKIIDFGAAFRYSEPGYLCVTTPEYLPPEYLNMFKSKTPMGNNSKLEFLGSKM